MQVPKYKLKSRFKIDRAIYIIVDIKYDEDKQEFLYLVNSTLFGYYEHQLKEEYFNFKEENNRRKKIVKK